MLVTEEEAANIKCPAAFAGSNAGSTCLATRCMWWRWGPPKMIPGGAGQIEDLQNKRGYCGMAGTP